MPTFEISLSDGRAFHVDAADQETAARNLQGHLQQAAPKGGVVDALRRGAADLLGGIGSTNKVLTGGGNQTLDSAANSIAPTNKADTTLFDANGLHAENIPNAIAEGAPGVAASLAAARLTPGPWWAKLATAGGVGLWQMLGPMAKQEAAQRTGDENATPTHDDIIAAAKRAIPEAAIMAAPVGGLAARGAAGLGLRGVADSAARSLLDTGAMGAANAGANAYDQAAQGNPIDTNSVVNAGLQGAATMAPFSAGHTVGDVKAAVKFRGIADEDPAHVSEAANRVNDAASNLGLRLRSQKDGATAIASAQSDVNNEFANTLDVLKDANTTTNPQTGVKTQTPMPQDVDNILARAKKGLPLSDDDTTRLASWSGNHGAVNDLVRLGGVSRALNGATEVSNGLSSAMESRIRPIANPLGVGVVGAVAHTFGGLGYTPAALAALGGAYGIARINDAFTGNRSRGLAFTRRFATGDGVPNLSAAPVAAATAPPGATAGPQAPPPPPQPAPGGPGLNNLNAMAAGLPWGPRNTPITGPRVQQMNPPYPNPMPWGLRNGFPTGPKVSLAPAPAPAPTDLSNLAPQIKAIAKNGPAAILAKLAANSPTEAPPPPAAPPAPPEAPVNVSDLKRMAQDALKNRAYADKLRANFEAQQANSAPPAENAAPISAPAPAAANENVAAEQIPSFLQNRGAPPAPAAPAGSAPTPDLASLMNSFTSANQAAIANAPRAPQTPEALKALMPKVTKLTKANGKVTPTVEVKAPTTPTAPPPAPKIESARPEVAPKVTPAAEVKPGDTTIPDFLNRTGKPIPPSTLGPLAEKRTVLAPLQTRPIMGDVDSFLSKQGPKARGPVSAMDMPDIPDFLKRGADNSLPGEAPKPTADVAAKALKKMLGARAQATSPTAPPVSKAAAALSKLHNAGLKAPTAALKPAELAMSSEDYADHHMAKEKPGITKGTPLYDKIAQSVQATDAKKVDIEQKLSEATGLKASALRAQLRPAKYRVQAQAIKQKLLKLKPEESEAINRILSDDVIANVWTRTKPKD